MGVSSSPKLPSHNHWDQLQSRPAHGTETDQVTVLRLILIGTSWRSNSPGDWPGGKKTLFTVPTTSLEDSEAPNPGWTRPCIPLRPCSSPTPCLLLSWKISVLPQNCPLLLDKSLYVQLSLLILLSLVLICTNVPWDITPWGRAVSLGGDISKLLGSTTTRKCGLKCQTWVLC